MTSSNPSTPASREFIDGSRVASIAVAKISVNNIQTKQMEFHPVPQIEECLLDDDRVVYRCNSKNGPCDYWSNSPVSVRSHLRSHSDRMLAQNLARQAAEAEERAAEAERELRERIARKSEGSKRGALTRKQKLAAQANGQAPVEQLVAPASAKIQALGMAIEATIDDLGGMADGFDRVRRSLQTTLHALSALEPIAAIDPEVLEKAAAFDSMQKLLNRPAV